MANKYRLKFSLSNGEIIDAGEIIVPEGAKGDKGDPYTLTSADKSAIVADVLAALPYYDGSVDISGGVELINFTIDGDHYEAEEGMTWEQWCNSEYNYDEYYKFVDMIVTPGSGTGGTYVAFSNNPVTPADVIMEYEYQLVDYGGSN